MPRTTGKPYTTTRKQREAVRTTSLRQERELLDWLSGLTHAELHAELARAQEEAAQGVSGNRGARQRVNDLEFELRVRAGDVNALGGRHMREIRLQRGLTHEDLARAIHWNRHTITIIERGAYKSFDIEALKTLSDALSTSVDFLFFNRKSVSTERRRRNNDNGAQR